MANREYSENKNPANITNFTVYGHTRKEHDFNFKRVLARSQERDINLNADKLEVGLSQVHYFGHMITSGGLKPDPEKKSQQ